MSAIGFYDAVITTSCGKYELVLLMNYLNLCRIYIFSNIGGKYTVYGTCILYIKILNFPLGFWWEWYLFFSLDAYNFAYDCPWFHRTHSFIWHYVYNMLFTILIHLKYGAKYFSLSHHTQIYTHTHTHIHTHVRVRALYIFRQKSVTHINKVFHSTSTIATYSTRTKKTHTYVQNTSVMRFKSIATHANRVRTM